LTEGTEEGCGELGEDSQCSGQESNCAPSNHNTSALPLHQVTGRVFSGLWKEGGLGLIRGSVVASAWSNWGKLQQNLSQYLVFRLRFYPKTPKAWSMNAALSVMFCERHM